MKRHAARLCLAALLCLLTALPLQASVFRDLPGEPGLRSASALVLGLGFVMALLLERAGFLYALAPLVAAAGMALIYGDDNDPVLELTRSTPASQSQILLARLVLVFGYDLLLALVATAGLRLFLGEQVVLALLFEWLAPMAFLSSLALLL